MIREIRRSDTPACADILCSVYNNDLWQNRWERAAAIEYLTDFFCMAKFVGYVMVENGEILGALFAREKVWWSGSEVYVEELFVKRSHQGRGYGTMLIKRVERMCRKIRWQALRFLRIAMPPAADFYRRKGFKDCEHVLFLCKEM